MDTPAKAYCTDAGSYLDGLTWFCGISIVVGYLMPNPVFKYILNI